MLLNRIQCRKCKTILDSNTVHHFQQCKCGAIAVDGGEDYLKRIGNREDIIELFRTGDELTKEANKKYSNPIEGLEV